MAPVLQRVLAGEDQFAAEQVEFAIEVSKLRFIPTCEYQAEGQHAKTHKRGLGRHNHTEQYQSYGLRLPELARALDSRPEVMHELAYCSIFLINNISYFIMLQYFKLLLKSKGPQF